MEIEQTNKISKFKYQPHKLNEQDYLSDHINGFTTFYYSFKNIKESTFLLSVKTNI